MTQNELRSENINEFPWLLFKIRGVSYAVNSKQISGITMLPPDITKLPDQGETMCGIMALRGIHIKVLDARALLDVVPLEIQRLNATPTEADYLDRLHRMVIIFDLTDTDQGNFGVAVDEVMSVDEITLLDGYNINNSVFRSKMIYGIGKTMKSNEVVLLLNYLRLSGVETTA